VVLDGSLTDEVRLKKAKYLVRLGADVNQKVNGKSLLKIAREKGYKEIENVIKESLMKSFEKLLDGDKFETIIIDNKNLVISVNTEKRGYRAYNTRFCLEIHHPEFKGRLFQPYIEISTYHFLEIVSSGIDLINEKFTDTHRIAIDNLGSYPNYSLVSDNNIKNNIINYYSVRFGKLCDSRKYTSKWIPGHLYCLSNRTVFLYLGPGKNVVSLPNQRYAYSNTIHYLFNDNILQYWSKSPGTDEAIDEFVKIVLPIYGSAQLDSIIRLRGKKVSIKDIISISGLVNNYIFSSFIYNSLFGYFRTDKPIRAMDLGEYVELSDIQDNTDLYPEITNESIEFIKDVKSITAIDADDLRLFNKSTISELLNKNPEYKDLLIRSFVKDNYYDLKTIRNKYNYKSIIISSKDLVDNILSNKVFRDITHLTEYEKTRCNKLQTNLKSFINDYPLGKLEMSDLYTQIDKLMV
jgi:hypothetical protein